MKNLITFLVGNSELQKLGMDLLKMQENRKTFVDFLKTDEDKVSFERFLSPKYFVGLPDIDIDIEILNGQKYVKPAQTNENQLEAEDFLDILKVAQQLAAQRKTDVEAEVEKEVLTAIDKVFTIQNNVAQNRTYILKSNNVEANRDLSIKHGDTWRQFLIHLNQLIDELELIAIAMVYKNHEDLHEKFNYLFGKENISNLLIKKGISPILVTDWLRIK